MKERRDSIREDLEKAIFEIYLKYQEKLGITDGYIHPCDAFTQDMIADNLASVIAKVITEELQLKKCKEGRR